MKFLPTTRNRQKHLVLTELDGSSTRWTYDDAYRLLSETRYNVAQTPITSTNFTYDNTGNHLTQTVDGVTTSYTYNEVDQLLSDGTSSYSYDDRGNLDSVTDGSSATDYNFDAFDRLAAVTLPDGTTANYRYDADGRRIQQTVGTDVTKYLWDERSQFGNVVSETDSANVPQVNYVLAGNQVISQNRGGTQSYYLHDGQGSTRGLANSAGVLTDTYSYDAFGELYSQSGSTPNNYLYTGQQFDTLTGNYSLRARCYDPGAGRFLSRDTYPYNYQNPVEINRYAYTANNPINRYDPTGHEGLVSTAINTFKSFVATRSGAAFVTGLTTGAIGSFLIYTYAQSHMCSDAVYEWTEHLDPVKFVLASTVIGAVAGGLFSLLPGSDSLTVSAVLGGTAATISATAAAHENVAAHSALTPCSLIEMINAATGLFGAAGSIAGGGGSTLGFSLAGNGTMAGTGAGAVAAEISGIASGALGGLLGIAAGAILATTGDGEGNSKEKEHPYYKRGRLYDEGNWVDKSEVERVNVKSESFADYMRKVYGSFRSNDWKKVMGQWRLPNGKIVRQKYWENKSGDRWYHINGDD